MPDLFDRASEREEEMRADALAAQARYGALPTTSAECCMECGGPIPIARQNALPGVQTCIDCQVELERIRKNRHECAA